MGRWIRLAIGAVAIAAVLAACSPPVKLAPVPTGVPVITPRAGPPTVAVIGDSIGSGSGVDVGEAWPEIVADRLGWRLTNLASGGAGFLTIGDRGQTFAQMLGDVTAARPRNVIIQGSDNDFGQDPDFLFQTTMATVADIRAALPHARIIGLSTMWNARQHPDELAGIDSQVRAAVIGAGGIYLDLGYPLDGHPEWVQEDEEHPNAEGHRAISDAVVAALAKKKLTL